MLLLTCSQILCGYVYNTVGINVKGNLNLRNSSSCRRISIQAELSQCLVIPCKLALALNHMDIHGCLVVGSG